MPLDAGVASGATNEEILSFMSQYQAQKRRCDEENGVLRNVVKRAKSAGVPVKAMIEVVGDSRRDSGEVIQELRERVRLLTLRNILPIATDLFEGMDLNVTSKARTAYDDTTAEESGYRAGRMEVPLEDCPFEPGSEHHPTWVRWWHNGKAAIARELGDNARQASAARGKPGRKAAAQQDLAVETPPDAPAATTRRGRGKANGTGRGRGKSNGSASVQAEAA